MAVNEVVRAAETLSVVCTHPATPTSGAPIRYGKLTGVALVNESAGSNPSGYTTVDFGLRVWDMVVDDNLGTGIAVGDSIYYHDSGTGTGSVNLNNDATSADAFFGIAQEVVQANATTLINVLHISVGAITAIANSGLDSSLAGSADGLGNLRAARFTLDPTAVSGVRSIAAHGLGVTLPDNALVLYGIIEILTTFTSATDAATIALSVEGANDLVTATAISSGTFWDAVKAKAVVPDALRLAGIATAVKLSASREITATVAVEALTGGKLVGWLFYVVGA